MVWQEQKENKRWGCRFLRYQPGCGLAVISDVLDVSDTKKGTNLGRYFLLRHYSPKQPKRPVLGGFTQTNKKNQGITARVAGFYCVRWLGCCLALIFDVLDVSDTKKKLKSDASTALCKNTPYLTNSA